MTFFINGSSYTHGDGLAQPAQDSWPVLFGQKLNSPIVNLSRSGASTEYIVYSTVKELSLNAYKKVIITWPALGRLMLVRRENGYFLHTGPGLYRFYTGGYIYADSAEFKDYVKLHYKYWFNRLHDLKQSLQQIVLLQEYLKNRECQYLFFNTNPYNLDKWLQLSTLDYRDKRQLVDGFDDLDDGQIAAEEMEIQSLYQQLDIKYYHDPINFNLIDWCSKLQYRDTTTGHPTITGHLHIAEYIMDLWKNLYPTTEEL